MDLALVSETLEALSDATVARRMRKEVQPLRGIRGTPLAEVARVAGLAAEPGPHRLPDDTAALSALFRTAWEDGLIAIGLVAATVPDDPAAALAVGRDWLTRVDDTQTADALGWMVLGPAALSLAPDGAVLRELVAETREGSPFVRRGVLAAGLALTPCPLEGAASVPVRKRLGETHVQWVEAAHNALLHELLTTSLRDEHPAVRKVLRRVLRTWAETEPEQVQSFLDTARGGVPRALRADVEPVVQRAFKRRARHGSNA